MENTPLKTNRMPYFHRYQATMSRQVSLKIFALICTKAYDIYFMQFLMLFFFFVFLQDLEESQPLRRDSESSENPEHDCIDLEIHRYPEQINMASPGHYDSLLLLLPSLNIFVLYLQLLGKVRTFLD